MASDEKKRETTPEILRMGKKEYLTNWNKSRGWYENSSSIFKAEKEDEKHHRNYWDTPVEWKVKRLSQQLKEFENDLGEGMWLMESILTSHFEKNLE